MGRIGADMGGAPRGRVRRGSPPPRAINAALQACGSIARNKALGKSPDQVRRWRNPIKGAIGNLIEVLRPRAGRRLHMTAAPHGKRAIGGGRGLPRHIMLQIAPVASHHKPLLKPRADCPRAAENQPKPLITAVARKLVTSVAALIEAGKWAAQTA